MSARAIARALRALEDERRLLRSGDLAALRQGAEGRRNSLEAALRTDPQGAPEALAALREAAARNARLLRAALAGLRDAGEEIERRATDRRRIGYGPSGEATTLSAGPGRERRA